MELSEKTDFSKIEISRDEIEDFGINMKDWAIISVVSLVLGILLAWGGTLASAANAKPVAATVNDTPIYETEITQMISEMRQSQGVQDNETWASWLSNNDYSPETIRQAAIESRVSVILLEQAAEKYGVKVSNEDVENEYANEAASYGGGEVFENMLASAGMTPTNYKERIRLGLIRAAIVDIVLPKQEVSDEQLSEAIATYYPDTFDPKTQKLSDLDPSLVEYVREALVANTTQMAWSTWFNEYRTQADIVINDMPQGLPYDTASTSK